MTSVFTSGNSRLTVPGLSPPLPRPRSVLHMAPTAAMCSCAPRLVSVGMAQILLKFVIYYVFIVQYQLWWLLRHRHAASRRVLHPT